MVWGFCVNFVAGWHSSLGSCVYLMCWAVSSEGLGCLGQQICDEKPDTEPVQLLELPRILSMIGGVCVLG